VKSLPGNWLACRLHRMPSEYDHSSIISSQLRTKLIYYNSTKQSTADHIDSKKYYLHERNVKPASSNNCNIIVSTSGCALSISSNRTTAFGQAFSCFVSWPPSSWPIYPGGEPINFATYHIISHNLYEQVVIMVIKTRMPTARYHVDVLSFPHHGLDTHSMDWR